MIEVGVGTRVINFLIDTLVIFLISFGLYKWWTFYVRFWNYKYFPFYQFFWFFTFIYYTIFEALTTRTLGKFVTMTKVKTVSGDRPAFYSILLRSLIRVTLIDAFFIPVLGRTLHDQLSNTRVVEV
jgi:uncharacterized RDD family membrane protein YckC